MLGGILYHRTGVTGPLALGCSLLGVDLIMRLLMVEKRIVAEVKSDTGGPTKQRQESEDTHEEDAEEPLLTTPRDQAYIIPPEQPWVIKSYPILYCFKDAQMLTTNWITLIQAAFVGTLDATIATVGKEYFDFDSLQTGLLFLPILLPSLLFGPVAGCIMDRQGPRTIVVWGYGLLVPILMSLRVTQPGALGQVLIYCFVLTLCGICLAVTNPPALDGSTLVTAKYHKANPEMFGPNEPYAQASSVTGITYNVGTAFGALLAGALKDAIGYGNMNLVIAALSLMTTVLGFLYIGEKPADVADSSVDSESRSDTEV